VSANAAAKSRSATPIDIGALWQTPSTCPPP
jgi:hypothetical protein